MGGHAAPLLSNRLLSCIISYSSHQLPFFREAPPLALEKEMEPTLVLAWEIPSTVEPGAEYCMQATLSQLHSPLLLFTREIQLSDPAVPEL